MAEGQSFPVPAKWDIGFTDVGEDGDYESYVPFAERLREEAAELLKGDADPKAKGKKPPPKKGAPVEEEEESPGPELALKAGEPLLRVALRLRAEDGTIVTGESGRHFSVTMFKERLGPAGDDGESEVLRRPVNFGDKRPTYHDPLDGEPPPAAAAKAKAKAKDAPAEEEEVEPPYPGDEAREGTFEGEFLILGESEEWFLPVHLQETIYWLRVADASTLEPQSCFPIIPPLEIPIRVKAA